MPKVYLGGDIMKHGSNLARQEEYDKFMSMGLNMDVYSPVLNKSINDKSAVTEEQNNHLAEAITEADIERLFESDIVSMDVDESAIGSLCEVGCLFGWKYMASNLQALIALCRSDNKTAKETLSEVEDALQFLMEKQCYFHSFDIRNTQLNEKGWRRSHSINQLLYGMILAISETGDLELSFDDVLAKIKENNK